MTTAIILLPDPTLPPKPPAPKPAPPSTVTVQKLHQLTAGQPADTPILILCDGDLEPAALVRREDAPACLQEDMPPGSLLLISAIDLSLYTTAAQ